MYVYMQSYLHWCREGHLLQVQVDGGPLLAADPGLDPALAVEALALRDSCADGLELGH